MTEHRYRSFLKAFTWRTIAFFDTALLSLLFTGHFGQAVTISTVELFTKSILYYLHERGWLRLAAWRDSETGDSGAWRASHTFSIMKAVSWRFVGSTDTFLIALFVTGNLGISASIGVFELATKTVLYYFHERGWLKVRWGTNSERDRNREQREGIPQPALD